MQNDLPPLSKRVLFFYSVADLPLTMAIVPVAIFVPAFYAKDLGLNLASIGFVLMLARFWDVLTDPIIGYLSDRTNLRMGRRRPYVIAAVPLVMISVYQLFVPPAEVTSWYLLGWSMALWLGWTLFNIPYYAWGAELSPDYEERTRVTGWRTVMGQVGNSVAMLVPAAGAAFFAFGGAPGEALLLIAVIALCLIPFCVAPLITSVPERRDYIPAQLHVLAGLRIMWSNAPFRRLIFAFVCSNLALALGIPVFVLFVAHVIEAPNAAPAALLIYFAANILGVPFWIWLAKKTDKHITWLCSITLMGCVFPFFMLLGPGDFVLFSILQFILGLGGGNLSVVPSSMKADVIDLDRVESGEDRAGLFFAAWSTATKVVQALGPGISLPILAYVGYDATGSNGPEQILALQAYFSFVPVIFYLIAGMMVIGYPITRQTHDNIRRQIATDG